LRDGESRQTIQTHFQPFIRYLEETDPELKGITSYMRKLDTFLFKILTVSSQLLFGNAGRIPAQNVDGSDLQTILPGV
jgi:hypothetical protein